MVETRDFDPQEFVDALSEVLECEEAMKQSWISGHPFKVREDDGTRHFSNLQCAARSALAAGGSATVVNMNTGQMWAGRGELMAAMQPPMTATEARLPGLR